MVLLGCEVPTFTFWAVRASSDRTAVRVALQASSFDCGGVGSTTLWRCYPYDPLSSLVS